VDFMREEMMSCQWHQLDYTVFQKKTPTHIIGYKLRNNCLILIIFDTKILHIIWHRTTAYLSTSPN